MYVYGEVHVWMRILSCVSGTRRNRGRKRSDRKNMCGKSCKKMRQRERENERVGKGGGEGESERERYGKKVSILNHSTSRSNGNFPH